MEWIITSNSNRCRIYTYDKNPAVMMLVKEINHPENRMKKSESLTTDKPGRYHNDAPGQGGAYSPRTDPKEVEIDKFAREIANELNKGRVSQSFKKLVIITPSHMFGLLQKHLDKNVKDLVKNSIQKDVMPMSHNELVDFLKQNIMPG